MRGRPHSLMLASALMALAGPSFLGAQRRAVASDVERPLSFDPLAMLRRPPQKERRRRTWGGAACGAKQSARYAKQISAAAFNEHFDRRIAWNESVYPRVLELQRKQRESSR